jgi:hypothetical protein
MPGPESEAGAQRSANEPEAIAADLRGVAAAFIAAVADLSPLADCLAELEAQLRAARHQAGQYTDPRPPARELAAEVLCGRLQALRPYIAHVTAESAEQAEEALRS